MNRYTCTIPVWSIVYTLGTEHAHAKKILYLRYRIRFKERSWLKLKLDIGPEIAATLFHRGMETVFTLRMSP